MGTIIDLEEFRHRTTPKKAREGIDGFVDRISEAGVWIRSDYLRRTRNLHRSPNPSDMFHTHNGRQFLANVPSHDVFRLRREYEEAGYSDLTAENRTYDTDGNELDHGYLGLYGRKNRI